MRTFHAVSLAIVLGATWGLTLSVAKTHGYDEGFLAGLESGLEDGERKGKEAKTLELAEVFAPYGYQKIRKAKIQCEAVSGLVCQIYGGFAPKVDVKRELETKKTGPM